MVQTVVFGPNSAETPDEERNEISRFAGRISSALGRTRTCGLLIRSQVT